MPLMPLFVMRPTLHTMTPLLHTPTPLPLCNSRTLPLGLGTSDAQLQNPLPLLHQMSNAGYSLALSDCTHRPSINFLAPTLLISLHSLNHLVGHISLDQLIALLSSHPSDPQALHAAVQHFRASKRAIFKARLVIVAGPASPASPHFFLPITPPSLFNWLSYLHAQGLACYCSKSHLSTCFSPLILIPTPPHPHHPGPACHCGRSRQDPSSLSLHLPPPDPHL